MLLITTFVQLRVVAGRRRTRSGRPHAVSGRPMLIHTCRDMPMPLCAVVLRSRFQNEIVVAWYGRGMVYVNQTRPLCVNQMGRTQSKPLAARHGRGTAWYMWISLKVTQWLKERLNVKRYATTVSTKLLKCQVCTVMFLHTEMKDFAVVSTSLWLRFLVRFLTLTTVLHLSRIYH
jgi:hypothetical protein